MKKQIALLLSVLSLGLGAGVLSACGGDGGESSSSSPQPTLEDIRAEVTPYAEAALATIPEALTRDENKITVTYQVSSGTYTYTYLSTGYSFGDSDSFHWKPERKSGELASALGVELSEYSASVLADEYHIFFKNSFHNEDRYYVQQKEPTGGTADAQKGCYGEITQQQYEEIDNILGFKFLADEEFAVLFDDETYGEVGLWNDVNNQSYCEYVYSGEGITVEDFTVSESKIKFDLPAKEISMELTINGVSVRLVLPLYCYYEGFINLYDCEAMKFGGKTNSGDLVGRVDVSNVEAWATTEIYPSIDLTLKYLLKKMDGEGNYTISLTETENGKTTESTYQYSRYLTDEESVWSEKYKCVTNGETWYKDEGHTLLRQLGDKFVSAVGTHDDEIFQKLPNASKYPDVELEWDEELGAYSDLLAGGFTELLVSYTEDNLTFTVVGYDYKGTEIKRQTFVYSDIGTTPTVELPEAQPCTLADIFTYAVETKTYDLRKDRGHSSNYCLTNGNGHGLKGTFQAEDGKYYAIRSSYQYEVSEELYDANMPHNSSEYGKIFDIANYQKVGEDYKITFNEVEYTVVIDGFTVMFTPEGSRNYDTLYSLAVLDVTPYEWKNCETSSYLTIAEVQRAVESKNYSCAGYQVLGDVYKQNSNYYCKENGVWYIVYEYDGEVIKRRNDWSLDGVAQNADLVNKVVSDLATENYTEYDEELGAFGYRDKDGKYIYVSFTAKHEVQQSVSFRVYENVDDMYPDEYTLYAFGQSDFVMPQVTEYSATSDEVRSNLSCDNYVITLSINSSDLVVKRDGDNFTYGEDIYIKTGEKYTVYEKQADGSYTVKENVSAAFPVSVLDDAGERYWTYENATKIWWTGDNGYYQRIFEISISVDQTYLFTNIEWEEQFTIAGFGTVEVTAPVVE